MKQKINSKSPVLNNLYEEPHYDSDANSNIDHETVIASCRPYDYDISIVPKRGQHSMFSQEDFASAVPNAIFINEIRAKVRSWRETDLPKASRIIHELPHFGLFTPERQNQLKLLFCQRESGEWPFCQTRWQS